MEVRDGIAEFPNGLKLRLTPEQVAPMGIYDAAAKHPDPPVPLYRNPDTGHSEPNPDDPAYKQGIQLARERRSWAATRAMIIMGTELVAPPAGAPGPDAIDWERLAAVRDVPAPVSRFDRYEMWLRYYGFTRDINAADGLAEFAKLVVYLAEAAGVTLEGVAAVVATFRDSEGRGATELGDAMATAGDGHDDRRSTGGIPGA